MSTASSVSCDGFQQWAHIGAPLICRHPLQYGGAPLNMLVPCLICWCPLISGYPP